MEVIDDLQDVIVDENDSPVQGEEVIITRCGQLEFKKKPKTEKPAIKGYEEEEKDKELDKPSDDRISSSHNDPLTQKKEDKIDRDDNKDPQHAAQHKKPRLPPRPRSSSRQDAPQVILKGRGAMKYKEHHSSPDYGRLR
jgi:hypothetical protein